MTHDPLDAHVEGLVSGDHAAFEAVYDLTAGLLASVANGLLGNNALAEDVVQDVFVKLTVHASGLRDHSGRALRAWLLTSVRNRCFDVRRSATARLERPTSELVDRPEPVSSVDVVLDRDLSPELRHAIDDLTLEQRTVLVLMHIGGLSGSETAAVVGRSRTAVYSLLRRAERSAQRSLKTELRRSRRQRTAAR